MRLTPEALFGPTPLGGPVATQAKLSPDGRFASYLRASPDDRERQELWLMDLRDGRVRKPCAELPTAAVGEMTAEEKAERERRRSFSGGITDYAWHPDAQHLVVVADGAAHLARLADDSVRTLTPPDTRQTAVQMSARGTRLSYVRDGDLFVTALDTGVERRLTEDGGGTVSNGLADFIAQEEMHRFDGHWWSPDERLLAFTRVDTAPVAESHRHEVLSGRIDVIAQRYPFAGEANADVRLAVLDLVTGGVRWLDWRVAEDDYLAQVRFGPDGALYVQAQSREQRRLALRRWMDGEWRELLTERAETWVNLHDNLKFAGDVPLWTSERDGTARLYTLRDDGTRPVPADIGRVNGVLAANATHAWVTGWRDDPTTQDVFEIRLRDGACRALTDGAAWHDGVANAKAGKALVSRSSPTEPGALHVIDLRRRRKERLVAGGEVTGRHPYFAYLDAHAESAFGRIRHAGETLHFRLTKPSPFDAGRRHPVVVHVYGGPGVQRVRREFAPLSLQLFAQAGFGVFELDNRGGSNRHKAFEDPIHGALGAAEVDDQLAGVDYVRSLPWVDGDRIGVFGHSYGGYMVLKALGATAGRGTFAAGVSVAPVTRWQLYDTHYTERYLGTPEGNPTGYAASSVFPGVEAIDVPLLLMHGMADDNVLFSHSTELMQALQRAGVPFELMTYPGAKHSLQEPSVAIHRYRHILAFFERTLGVAG